MKTIEEIAADIRRQRARIDEQMLEVSKQDSVEEILTKLQELRTRSESTNGSQGQPAES